MPQAFIDIRSISELHELYGVGKPKHPLITVIDLSMTVKERLVGKAAYRLGLYTIFCKQTRDPVGYGRGSYDFTEGSMMFTSPGQVVRSEAKAPSDIGWGVFFHADLIHGSALGHAIGDYSFFNYDSSEALHISEEEKSILEATLRNIQTEYSRSIDQHTRLLLVSNLELLLNYCLRFYDRQFFTRTKANTDLVRTFEKILADCLAQEHIIARGLPSVSMLAEQMHLSANYLSDLLQRFTGKTTLEHVHFQVIERAKSLLLGTDRPVNDIAYALGFEYPSQFTRLFKSKTGYPPSNYRHTHG